MLNVGQYLAALQRFLRRQVGRVGGQNGLVVYQFGLRNGISSIAELKSLLLRSISNI